MNKRVAVVGYALRFPGTDTNKLWDALLEGRDLVTEVASERWSKEALWHPEKTHPGTSYTFSAGSLGDVSGFDAAFFGMSPREVNHMDPQQRLLLELSWEAMERAATPPSSLRGTQTGVFMGIASVDYAYRYADDLAAVDANTGTGTASSIASNRISYLYDLKGPSISMDTACSSSTVAFHQACQSILSGECDQALAGGVSLHLHPMGFMVFSKASMLSPDGRCKTFDADGNGYVRSEGAGVFLLKDYAQAVADNDPIIATVAASAVNTDGAKSGLTVPNPDAQSQLIQQACKKAGLSVEQIDYLEAHGTGTAVGDPIETRAIADAIGKKRTEKLKIGSIKSNLGHLETASGVAGLAKALLSIQHRKIPATINLNTPNPDIDFEGWNIEPVTETTTLPASGQVTIGVNSFGFGGANAHVILQSPPGAKQGSTTEVSKQGQITRPLPLFLSARTEKALQTLAGRAEQQLAAAQIALYDYCWSAYYRREQHDQRLLLWAKDKTQCQEALKAFAVGESHPDLFSGRYVRQEQGPVWVYSGNGCQWAGMGQKLLQECAVVRDAVIEIDQLLAALGADLQLEQLLLNAQTDATYAPTEIAQPALFALQVGITRYFIQQGIFPSAVTGHSVGEVAAAWAAGALTLADAVSVIYYRSYYQGQTLNSGQMTAVAEPADQVETLLEHLGCKNIALAGINSPTSVTVSGAVEELALLEKVLVERGTRFKRLPLDYAFHSPCMAPIEARLKQSLQHISPSAGTVAFISTVTGQQLDGVQLNAEYWWENIRHPVLFNQAIGGLIDSGFQTFLEIGAHPVLRGYLGEIGRDKQIDTVLIATLLRDQDSLCELARSYAELLISGAQIDAQQWFPEDGRCVALPDYPWQRKSYWKPETSESLGLLSRYYQHPLLGYALPQNGGVWEATMDTGRMSWLSGHVVGDSVLFPGAGFVELALASAYQCIPEQALDSAAVLDVEDLEIKAPLVLEQDRSKVVRTQLDATNFGHISVQARDHADQSEWQTHLSARWFSGSAGRRLLPCAVELPNTPPDFTRAEHLALAEKIGLAYGDAFQAISHGWIDGDQVTAALEPTDTINQTAGGLLIHPGVLDSAFQLFIPLIAQREQRDMGYVPVQVGRIQLALKHAGEMPAQARVKLLRQSPHSLLAEVGLYSQQGEAIAVLDAVRFRAVRLKKPTEQAVQQLDMALVPNPMSARASYANVSELTSGLEAWLSDQSQNQLATELNPLLDTLLLAFLHEMLTKNPVSISSLSAPVDQWVNQAVGIGLLAEDANGLLYAVDPPEVDAKSLWQMLVGEYPSAFAAIQALGRFGLHLRDWFNQEPIPDALSKSVISRVYNVMWPEYLKSALYQQTIDWIKHQCQTQCKGESLHVAEISAGEMLLTPASGALESTNNSVIFSFLSASATKAAEAQERFKTDTGLQVFHWDANFGLPEQLAPLDLVMLYLDPSQHEQLPQLLTQAHSRLKPNGVIMLLGHAPTVWLERLLAAVDGVSNLPDQHYWQEQLARTGFGSITCLEDADAAAGPFLLTGQKVATVLNESVATQDVFDPVLCCDPAQVEMAATAFSLSASKIQTHLQQAIDEVHMQLEQGFPAHLVLFQGLEQATDIPSAAQYCGQLRDCMAELDQLPQGIACTVVTTGMEQALRKTANDFDAEKIAAQASVWGFVRTLMNESVQTRFSLVDVPVQWEQLDSALQIDAFNNVEHEEEQLISIMGSSYVPRLDYAKPERKTAIKDTQQQTLRLGFSQPGQLRHLQWRAQKLEPLAANAVLVAIKATGLNFRDVMYALGFLSDEAIENGYTGPNLGLEFAGVVEATGTEVTEFKPGDAVVGFGPASFSTKLTVTTDTLLRMPDALDFSAAATIPTTFFTVYYALKHLAGLEAGERVLIHGAAGGVGLAAVQVARLLGAEIYATVGAEEKCDTLRLFGVEQIYDSRSTHFAEDILADTTDGRGVDVVLNSLAGEAINQNLRVLEPFGRFLELGKRDFYENTAIGLRPFRNNISYFGVDSDQLMKVKPQLTKRLFREVMAHFEQGELTPLPYTSFAAGQVVEAFRYMQQAKQVGKVVVHYQTPPTAEHVDQDLDLASGLELDSAQTYIITGGLKGFGLRTAAWLSEKGVKHLALISRSGKAEPEDQTIIDQLIASGVDVQCYACDVAQLNQLQQTIRTIEQQQPGVTGVVHAAAVYQDGLAANMTDAQIQQVLATKAQGALNLHHALKTHDLQLFILFSSITTLFGNPGQANYVAANHALEALAKMRRAQGLAATCVRWGAIDDVGYLARNQEVKKALQSRIGGQALTTNLAFAHLESILLKQTEMTAVMDLDWASLSRYLPSAGAARYQFLARYTDLDDQAGDSADLIDQLMALDEVARFELVIDELKRALGKILMLPTEEICAEQSVFDLGFDSLMAVELISAVESRFGVNLPVMAINESPTLNKLADKLIQRMMGADTETTSDLATHVAQQHGVDNQEVHSD